MFGGVLIVAAVVAAEPGGATVHGEMGAVQVPSRSASGPTAQGAAAGTRPTTTTTQLPTTASQLPTTTTSMSTSTSTSTAASTATAAGGTETAAPTAQVATPDEVKVEDQVQDPGARPPAGLAAAPAGGPLADAAPVVLARRVWADGGALERLVEPSGDIVLHAVSPAGTVLSCTKVGSLYTLPIESQTDAAGGEVVHLVRDDSGALVRYVVQADGEPRAVTVLEAAPLALQ